MTSPPGSLPERGFSVDGVLMDSGPRFLAVHRMAGGGFTAGATVVGKMLPTPHSHLCDSLPAGRS